MEVNKTAVRLSLMQAVTMGIKKQFRAARVTADDPQDDSVRLLIVVLGLKFEVTIKEVL